MIDLEIESNDIDLGIEPSDIDLGVEVLKGADGITPTVTVTDITNGHNVEFYYGYEDPRNRNFDVMNGINGADGKNGTDGKDGINGTNGTNGADGITPSITVSDITGGHRLTVSYGSGDPRSFTVDIMNGNDRLLNQNTSYLLRAQNEARAVSNCILNKEQEQQAGLIMAQLRTNPENDDITLADVQNYVLQGQAS